MGGMKHNTGDSKQTDSQKENKHMQFDIALKHDYTLRQFIILYQP